MSDFDCRVVKQLHLYITQHRKNDPGEKLVRHDT